MKDISRNVILLCPVCGNDQFSFEGDQFADGNELSEDAEFTCPDCGKTFTKSELLDENRYVINANVEEFKDEVVREMGKEFSESIKKAFHGKSSIRIKI